MEMQRDNCIHTIANPDNNMHRLMPLMEQTCPDHTMLIEALISRVRNYDANANLDLLRKAYDMADEAHRGQKRKSGEAYIIHPLWVAVILATMEMDVETIIAGMLHDVVEDTEIPDETILKEFGDDVLKMVDGVTKLGQIGFTADKVEEQAQNLRKMFLAMSKDISVIIIKLADRLHNMVTLGYMKREKQIEKSEETLEIYAPIAGRLGIYQIQSALEDLSLRFLKPEEYGSIMEQLSEYHEQRDQFISETTDEVIDLMKKANISAKVYGRVKHAFSIYKKMVQQNKKTIDQIYDIFAIRLIVGNVKDCYAALGAIHESYTPVPGRFKDYIAMPKSNMYQSLHTTLIGNGGKPFEVQIRTEEMHKTAEYGIAAHWIYKEDGEGAQAPAGSEEAKMAWLRRILEWQQDTSDNKEFLNILKGDLDLFTRDVYCFTPAGDVKTLPVGSTPIDFAYSIHSAVGNKMVGARVNGKLVTIDYKIQNGDRIEVITSQNTRGPSRDWLKIVKSPQARSKINQWFRKEFKEENIVKGKRLLEEYCKEKKYDMDELLQPKYMEAVLKKYRFNGWEAALAAIGHGGIKEGQIVNRLHQAYLNDHRAEQLEGELESLQKGKARKHEAVKSKSGVVVHGVGDMAVRFSKCCNPVPGDEIVAFITRGRGLTIHRTDCQNIMNMTEAERERLVPAEWADMGDGAHGHYTIDIAIYAHNRKGLLMDIAKIFVENGVDLTQLNTKVSKQNMATIECSFEVSDTDEAQALTEKLRSISDIVDIRRPS